MARSSDRRDPAELVEKAVRLRQAVRYFERLVSKIGPFMPVELAERIFGEEAADAVRISLCGVEVVDLSSIASSRKAKQFLTS
ncbi:MAG: hypothetical protein ACP5MH_11830, partial [Thermoproteus sp.]